MNDIRSQAGERSAQGLALRQAIVDGAYWLREPGPNCQVVVAYMGAVAPEAIQATGFIEHVDAGSCKLDGVLMIENVRRNLEPCPMAVLDDDTRQRDRPPMRRVTLVAGEYTAALLAVKSRFVLPLLREAHAAHSGGLFGAAGILQARAGYLRRPIRCAASGPGWYAGRHRPQRQD